jgi:hypothetical protein
MQDCVETFETLNEKYVTKLKEILALHHEKERYESLLSQNKNEEDELEQFMNQLQKKENKDAQKNLQKQLLSSENELKRLGKLLKIVAPSNYVFPTLESISENEANSKSRTNSPATMSSIDLLRSSIHNESSGYHSRKPR